MPKPVMLVFRVQPAVRIAFRKLAHQRECSMNTLAEYLLRQAIEKSPEASRLLRAEEEKAEG